LLADDDVKVRSALRLLLEQQAELSVVGEAVHGSEVLTRSGAVTPDLVLLDWELPGPPSCDLLRALREACPTSLVVALSGRPEARQAALAAGADGFISKGDPPELVLEALSALCPGCLRDA
jgi:DNA-binding NarL/FixJ family response regulator